MSARLDFKGDYMGFSFGYQADGKTRMHSSDLGIVRVSDGSRFNENLLPTMQDKTVQVPGGDGMYYFGGYYTQRQFNVNFAFDSLTEEQIAKIKRVFGDKGIHDLVFDEAPYKIYSAKVTGTATIKYIPFKEGSTDRLYKGEGSIQFTCYYPFARSGFKFITNDKKGEYLNWREWQGASGMLEAQGAFDKVVYSETVNGISKGKEIPLYNPGDIEADFSLKLIGTESSIVNSKNVKMYLSGDSSKFLEWRPFSKVSLDHHVVFNSKTNLIEGRNENGTPTGNIYNQYIVDGQFFKIPCTIETLDPPKLVFDNILFTADYSPIEYNYYYL